MPRIHLKRREQGLVLKQSWGRRDGTLSAVPLLRNCARDLTRALGSSLVVEAQMDAINAETKRGVLRHTSRTWNKTPGRKKTHCSTDKTLGSAQCGQSEGRV